MLIAFSVGWVQRWETTPATEWTYSLPTDECLDIADQFYGDFLLTWEHTDCATVERQTRQAFDAWQANSNLRFVPVSSQADIEIRLSAADEEQPKLLAWATRDEIVLSRKCWYVDRTFCKSIGSIPRSATFATVVALQLLTGVPLIFIKSSQFQIALSIALISQYFMLYMAVWPCIRCFDLETAMMHEIGHIVGIGHTDDKEYNRPQARVNRRESRHAQQHEHVHVPLKARAHTRTRTRKREQTCVNTAGRHTHTARARAGRYD